MKFSPLFWHRVHIHEIYGIIITFQFSCVDCCINEMRELVTKCLYLTEKKKKSLRECMRVCACVRVYVHFSTCECLYVHTKASVYMYVKTSESKSEREREVKKQETKIKNKNPINFHHTFSFFADDYVHQIESILSHTHTFLSVSFSFARIFEIKRK